jgi:hypothetical protein
MLDQTNSIAQDTGVNAYFISSGVQQWFLSPQPQHIVFHIRQMRVLGINRRGAALCRFADAILLNSSEEPSPIEGSKGGIDASPERLMARASEAELDSTPLGSSLMNCCSINRSTMH